MESKFIDKLCFTLFIMTICVRGGDKHTNSSFALSKSHSQQIYKHLIATVTVRSALECAILCSRTTRCWGFKFHDSNKTCNIINNIVNPDMTESEFTFYKKTSGQFPTGKIHQQTSEIITRLIVASGTRLIGYSLLELNLPDLLVMKYSNISVKDYPAIKAAPVVAIVYMSATKQVIIGTVTKQILIVHLSQERNVSVIQTKVIASGLVVDESIRTVFVSSTRPSDTKGIYSIKLPGKKFQSVKATSGYPISITLDTTNKTMFLCFDRYIMSLTYQGKELHRYSWKGNVGFAMVLDQPKQIIYFTKFKELFEIDLVKKEQKKIDDLKYCAKTLLLHENIFYMSVFKSNCLYAYSLKKKTFQKGPKINTTSATKIFLVHGSSDIFF